MRSSRLLFVERHYTTVSSYPHPPVHNFRPYRHQPVDLEVSGRLAGDVSHDGERRCPTTSPSSSSCSSRSICWTRRTWCTRRRRLHASLPTPSFLRPSTTHTAIPVTSQTTASIALTQHRPTTSHLSSPRNFCMSHWHNGAILISGALIAPEISSAAGGLVPV
jgi:hypothetical protein